MRIKITLKDEKLMQVPSVRKWVGEVEEYLNSHFEEADVIESMRQSYECGTPIVVTWNKGVMIKTRLFHSSHKKFGGDTNEPLDQSE